MIFFWSGFAVRHARSFFLCDAPRRASLAFLWLFTREYGLLSAFFRKFAELKALKIRRARGIIGALILQ